ncbi:MAG: hypothetical protein KGJ45_12190 [Elusimicrobia bacterium]|nr:hypothetical protein [Elusimicrobiota bacterium]
MAQVTKDMCEHIIAAADRGERFPLTVNEMRQLAWLAIKGTASAATVAEPSNARNAVGACLHGVDVRKSCSACAAQQQAEPESVIKRQAQKIGELIADRDSWIEAHARLYRLYHDQSPRAGEEIHVNVEGGDVYTLPLQRSGMDKPRFVVHVPCSPQAEPGADESALYVRWFQSQQGTAYESMFDFARAAWMHRAAQSGQRAGVVNDTMRLDWITYQSLGDLTMHLVSDAPHDGEYYVSGDTASGYGKMLRNFKRARELHVLQA